MASTLNTSIVISGDHYFLSGSVVAGGTLPQAIFIYENTGDETLGEFYGTCNLQELGRLQEFTPGTAIPLFGNKFVRHSQIKINVPLQNDPLAVILALVQNVKDLSKAYSSQLTVTNSYIIP